ncbi:transcription factor ILI6-like [Ananas comosus]|uniref:Transcription factor ILI6-like n=1 Tax=Ananas comosus TaxID=4615 RepID=A0A6P5EFL8_ANACO|nr:transcription factor ILI6-like [Ananas comosus]
MSSRRPRSPRSSTSRITEDQINNLLSTLQHLLPTSLVGNTNRVSAARLLHDICNYIRSLHEEADHLSERLAELLAATDASSAQADIVRSLPN